MVRIFLCTDEPILEAGLRAAIAPDPELGICRVSDRVLRLASEVAESTPDILILQVSPEVTVRLLDGVRQAAPQCRVVLWVRDLSLSLAAQAVNVGVSGILKRTMSIELTRKCIARVAAGERWFEKDLIVSLLGAQTVRLTRRERQLVRLVAQGLSNKEIGIALDIKEATVKVYLSKLYSKTGVKDRLELALVGVRTLGLTGDESTSTDLGEHLALESVIVRAPSRESAEDALNAG